jgi:hypothetical protein
MAADLSDGVNDVLAHLLGERLELLIGEVVEVPRHLNPLQEVWHQ